MKEETGKRSREVTQPLVLFDPLQSSCSYFGTARQSHHNDSNKGGIRFCRDGSCTVEKYAKTCSLSKKVSFYLFSVQNLCIFFAKLLSCFVRVKISPVTMTVWVRQVLVPLHLKLKAALSLTFSVWLTLNFTVILFSSVDYKYQYTYSYCDFYL